VIDRSKVWTGTLNRAAVGDGPAAVVRLYDTTLRDGEQTVGLVLSPEQKLEIAQLVDSLGVDRIEVGFPRVSDEDRRAIELIVASEPRAELWGFARAVSEDVDAVLALGLRATVIEAPVSDIKLDALGVSRATIIERIQRAVAHAAESGVTVAFFGVDGSRADLDFLDVVYLAALHAGAAEVVAVDTLGVAAPEAAALLVSRVRETVGVGVPLHYHGHDDFGLATAGAVAAVQAGADWVHGTVNGMGERAGNANIPEVALALEALYGCATNLQFEETVGVSSRIQQICAYALAPWTPLVGENLFRRETGAVAAQFHDPPAVEPYASTLVGATRSVVLGKKSGADSIRIKAAELGLDVPEEERRRVLGAVKARAIEKRGLVDDDEFRALAVSGSAST
jgi:isopropylmalate/homocitrate/citramalate synthase